MRPQRHGRRVVLFRQVAQAGPTESCSVPEYQFSGFDVREMAARTGNPVFEIPRVAPGAKHFGIVIAFQERRVHRFQGAFQIVKGVAEIGENAEPRLAVIDDEGSAVRAVMGRGHGLDTHRAELQ